MVQYIHISCLRYRSVLWFVKTTLIIRSCLCKRKTTDGRVNTTHIWSSAPLTVKHLQGWGLLQRRDVKLKLCVTGCHTRHKHTPCCNSAGNYWARGGQPSPVSPLPHCLSRLSPEVCAGILVQSGSPSTARDEHTQSSVNTCSLQLLLIGEYIHRLKGLTHKEKPQNIQFPLLFSKLGLTSELSLENSKLSTLLLLKEIFKSFDKKMHQRHLISCLCLNSENCFSFPRMTFSLSSILLTTVSPTSVHTELNTGLCSVEYRQFKKSNVLLNIMN